MQTIDRASGFKRGYQREAKGQHRATLDAGLLVAAIGAILRIHHIPDGFCRFFLTFAHYAAR